MNQLIYNDAPKPRASDKDVFLANPLKNANFNTGFYQIPEIPKSDVIKPKGIVLWSKRHQCKNKSECALGFYEYDCFFDGKNGIYQILKYGSETEINLLIKELKSYAFVICPDYSVYGNFPNYRQIDAMARSREVGYVLWAYGVKVVINFRSSYEWTLELALSGIQDDSIVAVGSLGALRDKASRQLLKTGIEALMQEVRLKAILVYGSAPDDVFGQVRERGVEVWQFTPRHF